MKEREIMVNTPILFLVFNRPEKTQMVFESIRAVKPKRLYIAADAPRPNIATDAERCKNVRNIVQNIDWDCDVKYLFHEKNLGCSLAGKTAWDWIFSFEDEMIFIEDDGLASQSFFRFCEELLDKYRFEERIAYIGGVNYGLKYGNASYFFSRPPAATYCMATWKRVYELYEYQLESFEKVKTLKSFRESFINASYYKYFKAKCKRFLKYGSNTYDLQMNFLVHKYNLFSIYPNINLVSNIGLDIDGANNKLSPKSEFALKFGNRPRFEIGELIHPEKIQINRKFEKEHVKLRVFYGNSWFSIYIKNLLNSVKTILKYFVQ